ncbi:Putative mitochondrial LSU ribosomal protein L24 precursor [Podospora comata]|uniref:Mitochondrial LSU ribosomal protein L24 n=1 Tax=Podospora comata TaxID=48703 RepID=A0ABY6S7V3_PODCO|nr:Putative mitochondrial LSU ribosomal protein L24 precursor [Podospora comata]
MGNRHRLPQPMHFGCSNFWSSTSSSPSPSSLLSSVACELGVHSVNCASCTNPTPANATAIVFPFFTPPNCPPWAAHHITMSALLPARTCLRAATTTTTTTGTFTLPIRSFSTTPSQLYNQNRPSGGPIPSPTGQAPHIPPYPLGPRLYYKQSNTGLYGHATIRYGNNVSEKNEIKTRRTWRPNVHRKRLFSLSLRTWVQTRLTTRVLRTIDKVGGLDEYLLGIKSNRIKELGPWGWRLRWRIMQTRAVKQRFAAERKQLGLVDGVLEKQVREENKRYKMEQKQIQFYTKKKLGVTGSEASTGQHVLPDGRVVDEAGREAYIKETDAILAETGSEQILELGEVEVAKDEGFMKEKPAPKKAPKKANV